MAGPGHRTVHSWAAQQDNGPAARSRIRTGGIPAVAGRQLFRLVPRRSASPVGPEGTTRTIRTGSAADSSAACPSTPQTHPPFPPHSPLACEVVDARARHHGVVLDLGLAESGQVVGQKHELGLPGAKGLQRSLVPEGVLSALHHELELGTDGFGALLALRNFGGHGDGGGGWYLSLPELQIRRGGGVGEGEEGQRLRRLPHVFAGRVGRPRARTADDVPPLASRSNGLSPQQEKKGTVGKRRPKAQPVEAPAAVAPAAPLAVPVALASGPFSVEAGSLRGGASPGDVLPVLIRLKPRSPARDDNAPLRFLRILVAVADRVPGQVFSAPLRARLCPGPPDARLGLELPRERRAEAGGYALERPVACVCPPDSVAQARSARKSRTAGLEAWGEPSISGRASDGADSSSGGDRCWRLLCPLDGSVMPGNWEISVGASLGVAEPLATAAVEVGPWGGPTGDAGGGDGEAGRPPPGRRGAGGGPPRPREEVTGAGPPPAPGTRERRLLARALGGAATAAGSLAASAPLPAALRGPLRSPLLDAPKSGERSGGGYVVTSPFGSLRSYNGDTDRGDPARGRPGWHAGVDLQAPWGATARAPAGAAVLVATGPGPGGGERDGMGRRRSPRIGSDGGALGVGGGTVVLGHGAGIASGEPRDWGLLGAPRRSSSPPPPLFPPNPPSLPPPRSCSRPPRRGRRDGGPRRLRWVHRRKLWSAPPLGTERRRPLGRSDPVGPLRSVAPWWGA